MSDPITEKAAARHIRTYNAESVDEQAVQMADYVLAELSRALQERGRASLAVSGGRSPAQFFRKLDESDLDWSRVTLTLADERWVPPEDAQSNAGLVRRCMPRVFAEARWIPLYRGAAPDADAAAVSEDIDSVLPLDVLVLGVGPDGHTASLFPGEPDLKAALQDDAAVLCIAVPPKGERLPRLTMTGAVLGNARVRLLQVNGDDKRQVVAQAFEADPQHMPIAAFLAPPLDIFFAPDPEETHEPG